jgi:hypothetical protein
MEVAPRVRRRPTSEASSALDPPQARGGNERIEMVQEKDQGEQEG